MEFLCMLGLSLISSFSAAYSLYLYSGKLYSGLCYFSLGSVCEYLLMFLQWVPLKLLIVKGEFFLLWL